MRAMQELEPNDPQTLKDGRYALRGILGEGSMGRTYLADDSEAGRAVAVKVLYPSRLATVKDLELFTREAEILQKLSHPHIPAYVDAFSEGEGESACYYLVQTFVEGETLRARITGGRRWTEGELVVFARQLLEILGYMHSLDPAVVHRDIKPDNLIVGADGHPTLVDFGAVREVVRLTMGGGSTIIGSYGYMPPEQLMGSAIPASDLYSTGVTFLEMLTHQRPQDLRGDDIQRLVALANVADALRRVLERLCAPLLEDRYETATQVLSDLGGISGGGALVHASRIESRIAARNKERALALKRASIPGIIHYGYITLIALIVASVVGAILVVIRALAIGFQTAFLVSGIVAGSGLLMTLVLLTMRYTHDGWEPPNEDWVKSRGRVLGVEDVMALDSSGRETKRVAGRRVRYAFRASRGDYVDSLTFPRNTNLERCREGKEFDVYYQRGNPGCHELQDFLRDSDNLMARLFDPGRKHTPE